MIRSNTILILILVLASVFVGTMGYVLIEGWDFFDSFYMTIITLTTTGYREVHQLTENGRIFTVFLLIFGMGIVAYSITTFMSEILAIDFSARRRKKMEKQIEKLEKHTIICGFGRMGRVIAEELTLAKETFVVIEQDPDTLFELMELGYYYIDGNATHDDILLKAGVIRAKTLVSMVDHDGDALYISLAARSFNPDAYIIARASEEDARSKILRAGANKVILPIVMSGIKVAQTVLNPFVEDYLDLTGVKTKDINQRYQMADIKIEKGSRLEGMSLANCGFQRDGLIIVGIKKADDEFVFAPPAEYTFKVGDCLIALGTQKNYQQVIRQFT